jgi:hypothetical protein
MLFQSKFNSYLEIHWKQDTKIRQVLEDVGAPQLEVAVITKKRLNKGALKKISTGLAC